MQSKFSPIELQRVYDNKGLYRQLLTGFKIPQRVAECSRGVYYLPDTTGLQEVSRKEFLENISNIDDCIIKPSYGTDGGRGVTSLKVNKGLVESANMTIDEYIANCTRLYGPDFCIEKKIKECDNLQCLNPTSCNSLRVHTYRNRAEGCCKFISAYVRIGKKGQVVDNAHSGGFCARVFDDGTLQEARTVYPFCKYDKTESGVNLNGYKIDDFEKIKETAVKAHSMLPMFDLIGWDVAVDTDGEVVIIEFNPNPDIRIEQAIFDTSCLLEHQRGILNQAFG